MICCLLMVFVYLQERCSWSLIMMILLYVDWAERRKEMDGWNWCLARPLWSCHQPLRSAVTGGWWKWWAAVLDGHCPLQPAELENGIGVCHTVRDGKKWGWLGWGVEVKEGTKGTSSCSRAVGTDGGGAKVVEWSSWRTSCPSWSWSGTWARRHDGRRVILVWLLTIDLQLVTCNDFALFVKAIQVINSSIDFHGKKGTMEEKSKNKEEITKRTHDYSFDINSGTTWWMSPTIP